MVPPLVLNIDPDGKLTKEEDIELNRKDQSIYLKLKAEIVDTEQVWERYDQSLPIDKINHQF